MNIYIILVVLTLIAVYLLGDSITFRKKYRQYRKKLLDKPKNWPLSREKNRRLNHRYRNIVALLSIIDVLWIICFMNSNREVFIAILIVVSFIALGIGAIVGNLRCKPIVKRNCKIFGLSFPDMEPLGNS